MSKASGKVIVGGVVTMLAVAVGIGQVYLPYYSPQSQLRRDGNTMGKEAKEAEIARRKKFIEVRGESFILARSTHCPSSNLPI